LIRSLWYTSYVMPSAINRHQIITVKYLLMSMIGLGTSIGVMEGTGLIGSISGFVLVEIAMIVFVVPMSLKMVNDSLPAFTVSVANPPSLALIKKVLKRNKLDNAG